MGLRRSLQAVWLIAASLAFVQGKDAQLCSPCQTSAECGRIGSHTTLPNVVGGLPKGHILAAHFPTVCHHRSCVPLQVPSKDSFCKELKEALQSEELQQQQQTDTGSHSFTLSKLAHSLAEPVKKQLSGRKAFSSRPAARRLTQDVSPSPGGAGTMAALPTGETMNSEGKTATQTAVNTNSNGQLSTAGAGTDTASVIYVPGIGYVTPVNSDGTPATPATTTGMAHQPMYQAPSNQKASTATGGVTTQTGGQPSANSGTRPTGDAATNVGDIQVAGTGDAGGSEYAGDAGANGGINTGNSLSGGSQSSASGANAGLSTSQGAGYGSSSGSKATGSKASGSGSASGTGTEETGTVGSVGSVGGGQPTGKGGNYKSGTSSEKGSAAGEAGSAGSAGAAGGTADGSSASGSAQGSAGGTTSEGAGATGTAGAGAGASGSGKAGSIGAGSGAGASGSGTAAIGSVGTKYGGEPTAVQGSYGSGRTVSGGQASTVNGGSASGSGSAGVSGGGAASTTGSGSSSSSGSGSASSGGDQFSGQNAANQASANLGTFNSQFGGGQASSSGGGTQQGASVSGQKSFGSSSSGSSTQGASATGNPLAQTPAISQVATTNNFLETSQAANSQGLNPETTTTSAVPNTLQYSNGFVSFKADSDQVIPHTHNAAQCAQHCARSPDCVAWTRVAGGSKDVQTCYLKSSLDGAPSASSGGTTMMSQSGGAVQYSQPGTGNRQILESGTKDPKALPAALYGCPYPATSGGECKAPPSCNCYNGVCYGSCQ